MHGEAVPPKNSVGVLVLCSSSSNKSCVRACVRRPVTALPRPPHPLLNTVTVEYAAQQFCSGFFIFFFFNSQKDQRDDAKTSAHLSLTPPPLPTEKSSSCSQIKAKSQGHFLLCLSLSPAAECVHGDGAQISHTLVMPLTRLQMAASWHVTRL